MERQFDYKAALVHKIKPTTVATFEEYGKEAFLAFTQRELMFHKSEASRCSMGSILGFQYKMFYP